MPHDDGIGSRANQSAREFLLTMGLPPSAVEIWDDHAARWLADFAAAEIETFIKENMPVIFADGAGEFVKHCSWRTSERMRLLEIARAARRGAGAGGGESQ